MDNATQEQIPVSEHKTRANYLHLIEPAKLVVDWSKNLSRGGLEPPVDEALISLARDMAPKIGDGAAEDGSSGQLNPILVRLSSNKQLEVIGGFRRMRAALYLVESGLCPDFKIKYVIGKMSDAEAALINISENIQREDPKPIQLAYAVRSLTEDYGLSLAVVAGRLKRSAGYLSQLLDLLVLPTQIREAVANGEATVTGALELTKISGVDQISVFRDLSENGEKVTAKRVKAKVREKQEEAGENANENDDENNSKVNSKPIRRDLSDLVKWLELRTGEFEPGNGLACGILDWVDGKLSDAKLEKLWMKEMAE